MWRGHILKVQDFTCPGGHGDEIPVAFLPQGYLQPQAMAEAALALNARLASLPFDCVLEAEAAGMPVRGYDDGFGLRPAGTVAKLQPPDLTQGRPQLVLEALGMLAAQGKATCLNLSGPFTVASQLLGTEACFDQWRGSGLQAFFAAYQQAAMAYVGQAARLGVNVLSYSDPLAALSLVGPAMAGAIAKGATMPLLQGLEGLCTIHVCGKTSAVLVHSGCARLVQIPLENPCSYAAAVAQQPGKPLLGGGCLKSHATVTCLRQVYFL